nr:hypothetical protein [uncultured Acetatifactor sp.]
MATDLYKSIQSENARQAELDFRKTTDPLTAEDIATAVVYAIEPPDRMSVSEIMLRPTKQGIDFLHIIFLHTGSVSLCMAVFAGQTAAIFFFEVLWKI